MPSGREQGRPGLRVTAPRGNGAGRARLRRRCLPRARSIAIPILAKGMMGDGRCSPPNDGADQKFRLQRRPTAVIRRDARQGPHKASECRTGRHRAERRLEPCRLGDRPSAA